MTKKSSTRKIGEVSEFRKWVRQNANKYDLKDREGFFNICIKKFNISWRRVKDCIAFMRREGEIPINAFMPSGPATESIDDIEKRIVQSLKELGNNIIKDNDFRVELSVSKEKWREIIHLPCFSNNRYEIRGKKFRGFYWGSMEVIKDLKKKIEII